MKTCQLLLLMLLCLVMVQSRSKIPEPPSISTRIGPFYQIGNDNDISPQGDDQDDAYGTKSMFQGDIKDPGRRTGGKVGEAGTRTPWPDAVIPYVFDCSVLSIESAVKATYDAMEEWETRTCVRFVKKQSHHRVYLEFIRAAGCWATYVGYKGRKTQISIGNGCDYKHVMIHELGHVIGFWHEQSRPDRDNYIRINYHNVVQSLRYNFDIVKEQTNNYGEAYDFNSIMHYPFNAFAIDRTRNTIFPKDSRILSTAKPYKGLSESDVRQTRKMYQCSKMKNSRAIMKKNLDETQKINWASTGGECKDRHKHCVSWATHGYCSKSPDPMLTVCPASCDVCTEVCEDNPRFSKDCPAWADYHYCLSSNDYIKSFMLIDCRKSCRVCSPAPTTKPTTKPTTLPPKTTKRSTSIKTTKRSVVKGGIRTPSTEFTGVLCKDRSKHCKEWANDGRCDTDRWVYKNCMLSCKRFTICDQEIIKPIGSCTDPLGVHSAKIIPDRRMRGSSTFSPGGGWYALASSGRLYKEDDHAKKHVGAWCASPSDQREKYLQIDFGRRRSITALATQGRDVYFEHVKSYSLKFSDDRSTWHDYREGGDIKVFDGNCDHVTPVLNLLERSQTARYIRILPIKYVGAACLRVEVYGC